MDWYRQGEPRAPGKLRGNGRRRPSCLSSGTSYLRLQREAGVQEARYPRAFLLISFLFSFHTATFFNSCFETRPEIYRFFLHFSFYPQVFIKKG